MGVRRDDLCQRNGPRHPLATNNRPPCAAAAEPLLVRFSLAPKSLRGFLGGSLAATGDQEGDEDRNLVEDHQGAGHEELGNDIRSRGEDSAEDKGEDNGEFLKAP